MNIYKLKFKKNFLEKNNKTLLIDASNIRIGGTANQLINLINHLPKKQKVFKKIIIYGNKKVLSQINKNSQIEIKTPWLLVPPKNNSSTINLKVILRFIWHKIYLPLIILTKKPNLIFYPSAVAHSKLGKFVCLVQNSLPFMYEEYYPKISIKSFKFSLLKKEMLFSIRKSAGTIFLNDYSNQLIKNNFKKTFKFKSKIIPHGCDKKYKSSNWKPIDINYKKKFISLTYVSSIDTYKHQRELLEGLYLFSEKYKIDFKLNLIGPILYEKYFIDLKKDIYRKNLTNKIVIHKELTPHEIISIYKKSHCAIFASSCENLPFILIEAINMKIPIICSNKKPMTDIFFQDGFHFDPFKPYSICETIYKFYKNYYKYIEKIKDYKDINLSWYDCSQKTLDFFESITKNSFDKKNN